ncbi:MAG: hypothetical protein AAFP19_19660, partial [Bacteroidota bacterium]
HFFLLHGKVLHLLIELEEMQEKMLRLQSDEIKEQLAQQQEELKAHQLELKENQMEQIEQLKELEELQNTYIYIDSHPLFSKPENLSIIEEELLRDGLIDDRTDYSLQLSNKKMKVNGQKMSKAITQKYIDLYEKLSGQHKGMNFNIQITK